MFRRTIRLGYKDLEKQAIEEDGLTPLMHAIRSLDEQMAISVLLDKKSPPDIHALDPFKRSALEKAIRRSMHQLVRLLFMHGARLSHLSAEGRKELLWEVVRCGDEAMVEVLLPWLLLTHDEVTLISEAAFRNKWKYVVKAMKHEYERLKNVL